MAGPRGATQSIRPAVTRLKSDLFGHVEREDSAGRSSVLRDTRSARWWARPLARHLLRREKRALMVLEGVERVPKLLHCDANHLRREWIEGLPMQRAAPPDARYFREALRLVRLLHARDLTHDDLAKEPNWLVTPEGLPALVDFQLARHAPRRDRLFRMLAHDDLRHMLKHKRRYRPERLTARERAILASPSPLSRLWRATGKRLYRFVTRRLLGWADREGAGDRLV
ncbi:MAG: serine/threonine protein kinase [Gammaproteobacteria bacterium]|nr:serine/threonine protein kinase [Gammaproteobacteria bacterium]